MEDSAEASVEISGIPWKKRFRGSFRGSTGSFYGSSRGSVHESFRASTEASIDFHKKTVVQETGFGRRA